MPALRGGGAPTKPPRRRARWLRPPPRAALAALLSLPRHVGPPTAGARAGAGEAAVAAEGAGARAGPGEAAVAAEGAGAPAGPGRAPVAAEGGAAEWEGAASSPLTYDTSEDAPCYELLKDADFRDVGKTYELMFHPHCRAKLLKLFYSGEAERSFAYSYSVESDCATWASLAFPDQWLYLNVNIGFHIDFRRDLPFAPPLRFFPPVLPLCPASAPGGRARGRRRRRRSCSTWAGTTAAGTATTSRRSSPTCTCTSSSQLGSTSGSWRAWACLWNVGRRFSAPVRRKSGHGQRRFSSSQGTVHIRGKQRERVGAKGANSRPGAKSDSKAMQAICLWCGHCLGGAQNHRMPLRGKCTKKIL